MTSYVIDGIDKAAKKTRELLLPFDLGRWTKLALIVLLTGGIGIGFPFPGIGGADFDHGEDYSTTSTDADTNTSVDSIDSFSQSDLTGAFAASGVFYAGFAVLIGFILSILLISSVFEFIYYSSLIDEEVKIVEKFSANLERGARYFLLRFVFSLALLLVFGGTVLLIFVNPLLIIPVILAAIPLAIVLFVFNTMVHDFVLLEMLQEDMKFTSALKSVYSKVEQDWRNFGLYVLLKLVLSILVTSALGIGMLFVLVALAIPLIIVGVIGAAISDILILPVVLFGLLFVVLSALYLSVPAKTFLYYYAISVYSELPE